MAVFRGVGLTTLDAMLVQINTSDGVGDQVDEDEFYQELIHISTDMIHQLTRRLFLPYVDTKTFDARGEFVDGTTLWLNTDLLAVTTLTNGDGSTIAASSYRLRPKTGPAYAIELLPSAGLTWLYETDWQDAISIAGIWGFHEDYENAWVDTLDTVQDVGGINASTQTITVSDADGRDDRYMTRFQVEHLLKIEDEFLRVVAVNTTTNELTVLRGQLGSTAATHANGTSITRYAAMGNIEKACRDLVLWMIRNRATSGEKIALYGGYAEFVKNEAPANIAQAINAYTRMRVR